MTRGDRVVVLESEHRGEIDHVDAQGLVWVQRDDLPAHYSPVPYDAHELELANVRAA